MNVLTRWSPIHADSAGVPDCTRIYRGLILLGLILSLISCANVSQKFKSGTKADIGFFTDQTIAMLGNTNFGFSENDAVHSREFFDEGGTEEQEYLRLLEAASSFMNDIVDYSLELVVITDTTNTETEWVAVYSNYISDFNDELLEKLQFTPEYYNDIIVDVQKSEDTLSALRAAQPIINAAGRYLLRILDQLIQATDVVALRIDTRIDESYTEVIWFQNALEEEKYNVLGALAQLYLTYKGDQEAYEKLKKSNVILKEALLPGNFPTKAQMLKIKDHLMDRLSGLHLIGEEIQPDWERYQAAHTELDRLHVKMLERIDRARLVTLVWLRAHQKMASGVKKPAEWFELKDLPRELYDVGKRALL